MSTDYSSSVAAEYGEFLLENRIVYATAALVVYEHLITLKYEIDFLWRRKWGAATWIFVSNRYLLLLGVLFPIAPISSKTFGILKLAYSCADAWAMNLLEFFAYGPMPNLPFQAFTVLRGFALLRNYPWKHLIMWTLMAIVIGPAICDAYEDLTQTWEYIADPVLGSSCYQLGYSAPPATIEQPAFIVPGCSMLTAGVICGIILATIVFTITLVTTVGPGLEASSLGLKTLSQILLRDGSMLYLLALFGDTLSIMTTNMVLAGPAIEIVIDMLAVLPAVLLSRFLINLREVESPTTIPSDNWHPSRFSIPNFRMPTMDDVIGNLGEPLDFVEYRVEDGEDDERDPPVNESDSDGAQQDVENAFEPTLADVDAAEPSGSGSGSAAAVDKVMA